jgi:hypothetical protein
VGEGGARYRGVAPASGALRVPSGPLHPHRADEGIWGAAGSGARSIVFDRAHHARTRARPDQGTTPRVTADRRLRAAGLLQIRPRVPEAASGHPAAFLAARRRDRRDLGDRRGGPAGAARARPLAGVGIVERDVPVERRGRRPRAARRRPGPGGRAHHDRRFVLQTTHRGPRHRRHHRGDLGSQGPARARPHARARCPLDHRGRHGRLARPRGRARLRPAPRAARGSRAASGSLRAGAPARRLRGGVRDRRRLRRPDRRRALRARGAARELRARAARARSS